MTQPKFNVGDLFCTTSILQGDNLLLTLDRVDFRRERYLFVSTVKGDQHPHFNWKSFEMAVAAGKFYPFKSFSLQKEEEHLTQEYINSYKKLEHQPYNSELDFTKGMVNLYGIDNLNEEESLVMDTWVNTPKDTVNNFLDKMMKEH